MIEKKEIAINPGKIGNGISDKLVPLKSLDVANCRDFDELLKAMSFTAFDGRRIGEAADVLYEMFTDDDCFVVLTLSGAMTMAKMGLLICEMIDRGMVNAIVSTGALMSHGFVESVGMTHFKNPENVSDEKLYKMNLNRVYDTLEPEQNLDEMDVIVEKVFEGIDSGTPACSHKICYLLGKYLHENTDGRGILKSAYVKKVPVFIPAFTDSEIGLDFALLNRRREIANKPQLSYNPFFDLEHYTDIIFKAKKTGIFTIGGGVPRKWAQQVAPYLDLIGYRIIDKVKPSRYFIKDKKSPYYKPFSYGVRICPEPVHWGGLSGCTYSESVSWGKFVPKSEGGRHAEVLCDATIAWPIVMKAVMERIEKNKIAIQKNVESVRCGGRDLNPRTD